MTDTTPSATLAAIRERAHELTIDLPQEDHCGSVPCTGHDALRLVAALEAVLERHSPGRVTILGSLCKHHESHRHFSITRTEADGVRACPDCTADVYVSCAGCGPHVRLDSCPDRTRITSALTGEEPQQ